MGGYSGFNGKMRRLKHCEDACAEIHNPNIKVHRTCVTAGKCIHLTLCLVFTSQQKPLLDKTRFSSHIIWLKCSALIRNMSQWERKRHLNVHLMSSLKLIFISVCCVIWHELIFIFKGFINFMRGSVSRLSWLSQERYYLIQISNCINLNYYCKEMHHEQYRFLYLVGMLTSMPVPAY